MILIDADPHLATIGKFDDQFPLTGQRLTDVHISKMFIILSALGAKAQVDDIGHPSYSRFDASQPATCSVLQTAAYLAHLTCPPEGMKDARHRWTVDGRRRDTRWLADKWRHGVFSRSGVRRRRPPLLPRRIPVARFEHR